MFFPCFSCWRVGFCLFFLMFSLMVVFWLVFLVCSGFVIFLNICFYETLYSLCCWGHNVKHSLVMMNMTRMMKFSQLIPRVFGKSHLLVDHGGMCFFLHPWSLKVMVGSWIVNHSVIPSQLSLGLGPRCYSCKLPGSFQGGNLSDG